MDALLDVSRLQGGALDLDIGEVDLSALIAEVVDRARTHRAGERIDDHVRGAAVGARAVRRFARRSDRHQSVVERDQVRSAASRSWCAPASRSIAGRARAFVSVTDEGIGVAPEDQGRIFERFERAVSRTHYGGLGLGLWISKQIAESLGGSLTVESDAARARASPCTCRSKV